MRTAARRPLEDGARAQGLRRRRASGRGRPPPSGRADVRAAPAGPARRMAVRWPRRSPTGCGTTTTGRDAWCTRPRPTEPSSGPENPPGPRPSRSVPPPLRSSPTVRRHDRADSVPVAGPRVGRARLGSLAEPALPLSWSSWSRHTLGPTAPRAEGARGRAAGRRGTPGRGRLRPVALPPRACPRAGMPHESVPGRETWSGPRRRPRRSFRSTRTSSPSPSPEARRSRRAPTRRPPADVSGGVRGPPGRHGLLRRPVPAAGPAAFGPGGRGRRLP